MNLRGAQISFKEIFFDKADTPVISLTKIQGRNQDLNRRRNECLVDRYYYTARRNGTGTSYEHNIKEVAEQFFLSPYHASKVILSHNVQLTELKLKWKNEQLDKLQKHLSRKWPHLSWA